MVFVRLRPCAAWGEPLGLQAAPGCSPLLLCQSARGGNPAMGLSQRSAPSSHSVVWKSLEMLFCFKNLQEKRSGPEVVSGVLLAPPACSGAWGSGPATVFPTRRCWAPAARRLERSGSLSAGPRTGTSASAAVCLCSGVGRLGGDSQHEASGPGARGST